MPRREERKQLAKRETPEKPRIHVVGVDYGKFFGENRVGGPDGFDALQIRGYFQKNGLLDPGNLVFFENPEHKSPEKTREHWASLLGFPLRTGIPAELKAGKKADRVKTLTEASRMAKGYARLVRKHPFATPLVAGIVVAAPVVSLAARLAMRNRKLAAIADMFRTNETVWGEPYRKPESHASIREFLLARTVRAAARANPKSKITIITTLPRSRRTHDFVFKQKKYEKYEEQVRRIPRLSRIIELHDREIARALHQAEPNRGAQPKALTHFS